MKNNAEFFSSIEECLEPFSTLMIELMPLVDILASWRHKEKILKKELSQAYKIHLELLTPFWNSSPWTKALEDKKVLVVHLFVETIRKQYLGRELIHKHPNMLPKFELKTLKAVESIGGDSQDNFENWLDALKYMQEKIDKIDYQTCIIGCGTYDFPFAVCVKHYEKKAIHIGGAT